MPLSSKLFLWSLPPPFVTSLMFAAASAEAECMDMGPDDVAVDRCRATAMPTGLGSINDDDSTEDTESGDVTVSLFSLCFLMLDESLPVHEAGLVNNESLEL